MTTAIRAPASSLRDSSIMPGLRMGFDSMAAWDKTSLEFDDHILKRAHTSTITPRYVNKIQGRSFSDPIYKPPSFRTATSSWSPPASPTSPISPSSIPRSIPTTVTPPRSPQVNPSTRAAPTLTPRERHSLATKLYAAACTGDLAQISILISLGAPLNTATQVKGLYEAFKPAKNGHLSALAGAASHGQIAAAQILLSHGAHVSPSVAQSSSSPLHQACHADDIDMARFLLAAGADVDVQNCYNSTPLMYAVKYGSSALVALVLSYYPRLESTAFMETTAAHWAVFNSRPEALALLLRAGANPDARMVDGSSPLHCAAMSGAQDTAGLLVEFGADVVLRDEQERTPGEVAVCNGRGEFVEMLQRVAREKKARGD